MNAIEYELTKADRATLIADSDLVALFGAEPRVYETPPTGEGRVFPYITIEHQVVGVVNSDDDDCVELDEVYTTINSWTQTGNKEQGWAMNRIVKAALKGRPSLTGYSIRSVEALNSRCFGDPNPSQHHGIVEFRRLIETTS